MKRVGRWIGRIVLGVAVLWITFLGFIAWAMRQTPETFGRVMAKIPQPAFLLFPFETMWTPARQGRLHPGDAAPDLPAKTLETKNTVSLSSLWAEKPVVLVFGSYT